MRSVHKSEVSKRDQLKTVILESFTSESGKCFYSIEVTPKSDLKLNLSRLKTLPLFVDITWIRDENLQTPIRESPAFQLADVIKSSEVVNSITCYKLNEKNLDEILLCGRNFTVLRGGKRFRFSNSQKNLINSIQTL